MMQKTEGFTLASFCIGIDGKQSFRLEHDVFPFRNVAAKSLFRPQL